MVNTQYGWANPPYTPDPIKAMFCSESGSEK